MPKHYIAFVVKQTNKGHEVTIFDYKRINTVLIDAKKETFDVSSCKYILNDKDTSSHNSSKTLHKKKI